MDVERLTAREVAGLWGVTAQAVGLWHRAGCPRNEDGTYALKGVIGWREARIREEEKSRGEDRAPSLERMRQARAEQEELKLSVVKGELLRREDVERGRVARVVALKRGLLALPRVAAPLLVGLELREIQALLKEQIEERIREFAGGKKRRR